MPCNSKESRNDKAWRAKGIVNQNAINPIKPHEKPNDGTINVCYFSTPHRGLEVLLNAWDFMKKQLGAGKNAKLNVFSSFKIYDNIN